METLALLLYLFQQLGIALGVGAATFSVVFYIVGSADGTIDSSEARFIRLVHIALKTALWTICVTGLVITGAHEIAGDAVIYVPAYLAKWLLIVLIICTYLLVRLRLLPLEMGSAFAGGTWFALYALHVLAPDLSWIVLIFSYVVWMSIFGILFVLLKRGVEKADTYKNLFQAPPQARAQIAGINSAALPIGSEAEQKPAVELREERPSQM